MRTSRSAIVLWAIALSVVLVVETIQLSGVFDARTAVYTFHAASIGVVFTTLGRVILRRHPSHRVGRLLLVTGLLASVELAMSQVAHWIGHGRLAGTMAVSSEALRMIVFGALGLLLLIYPTGHLPTKRWRWAVVLLGFFVFGGVGYLITPQVLEDLAPLRGPLEIPALLPVAQVLEALNGVAMIGVLAAVASLVVRFRRAPPIQRQQIKMFTLGAVGCVVVIVATNVLFPVHIETTALGDIAWGTPNVFIPAAAALAITRHGLYDIDRIVSRTLAYAIVTGLLVGVFALVVLVPTAVVGAGGNTPDWVIAVATLAVAALFRPVRRRVQDVVDHRFNRKRYDAELTIDAFALRLREQIDIDALGAELREVVVRTMQPVQASIWLRR